jgi:hypothetical protein
MDLININKCDKMCWTQCTAYLTKIHIMLDNEMQESHSMAGSGRRQLHNLALCKRSTENWPL